MEEGSNNPRRDGESAVEGERMAVLSPDIELLITVSKEDLLIQRRKQRCQERMEEDKTEQGVGWRGGGKRERQYVVTEKE